MKIRTDFVTNSSSSSFIITIAIDTNDGVLSCELSSGIEERYESIIATRSPEEMGQCSSVEDLMALLRTAVKIDHQDEIDEDYCDEFVDFISSVGEIESIDEIKSVTVSSTLRHGHTDAEDTEVYTYYREQNVTVHAKCSSSDDSEDEEEYYDEDVGEEPEGEIDFHIKGKVVEGEVSFESDGPIARLS